MSSQKKRARIAVLLAVWLCLPGLAPASLILPSTEAQMTERAELIVVGTVTHVESWWDGKRSLIRTDAIIAVDQALKGADRIEAGTVTVRFDGGKIGGRSDEIDGAPAFYVGEEVVCFLKPNLDGATYHVFALYYGKYHVAEDAKSGTKTVDGPSFDATRKYDLATGQPVTTGKRPATVTLDEFLAEIRGYLAGD